MSAPGALTGDPGQHCAAPSGAWWGLASQVRARLAEIFPMIDTNRDTYIDQAELLAWHDANGACSAFFAASTSPSAIAQHRADSRHLLGGICKLNR